MTITFIEAVFIIYGLGGLMGFITGFAFGRK